jgi:hypothetical protein
MSTSLIVVEAGNLPATLGPDFAAAFDLARQRRRRQRERPTRPTFACSKSTAMPRVLARFQLPL